MLDIHVKWLLVLLVNFFVLIYVLNIILFKPLLKIFDERADTVKASLDAAREMNARKDEAVVTMNRELAAARGQAKEVFDAMKNEGTNRQKDILSESEAKAADMLQAARAELRAEVDKARQALKSDVEKFSDEIVRKLVNA